MHQTRPLLPYIGRKDNINHHQQSHRISSSFCFVCSETFAPQDTLNRHIAFHLNTGNLLAPPPPRATSLMLPPSAHHYLRNYARYYDHHHRIIHRSNFLRLQEWPALFCAVLAIEALFSLDMNVAYNLSQMQLEVEPPLQFIQSDAFTTSFCFMDWFSRTIQRGHRQSSTVYQIVCFEFGLTF
jgi:hypothetical protein